MEKITQHTGVGVPLRRSNVDTDQIIPAVWLKQVSRTGFEKGLFSGWREDPEFVLNKDVYTNATVLVAGLCVWIVSWEDGNEVDPAITPTASDGPDQPAAAASAEAEAAITPPESSTETLP